MKLLKFQSGKCLTLPSLSLGAEDAWLNFLGSLSAIPNSMPSSVLPHKNIDASGAFFERHTWISLIRCCRVSVTAVSSPSSSILTLPKSLSRNASSSSIDGSLGFMTTLSAFSKQISSFLLTTFHLSKAKYRLKSPMSLSLSNTDRFQLH